MANSPQDARTQDQRTGAAGASGGGDTSTFSASFVPLSSEDTTAASSAGGQGSGVMTSSVSFPAYVARETASPHPYMLRPGLNGKYYIYLPKGCLVVNGEVIDVESKFKGVSKNESVLKYPWHQYPVSVMNGGMAVAQFMNVTLEWDKNNDEYTVKSVEFTSGSAKESGSGSGSDEEGDEKEKTVTVPISRPDGTGRPSPVVSSAVHLSVFDLGARIELKDKSGESDKTIKIDIDDLESCDEDEMSIKTIKWPKKATDEDPETTGEAHILACKDIDLSDTITAYSADTGIKISESSNDGTEGSSSNDSSMKIKNMGVLSIAFGNSAQQSNGTLKIVGAEGSGLEVTGTDFSEAGEDGQAADYTNGTCNFDLKGRGENDKFAVKTVTLPKKGDVEEGAANKIKVLATDDIDLSGLGGGTEIKAGTGSDNNNIITVTAPTGEEKAYTLYVPEGVLSLGVSSSDKLTGDVKVTANAFSGLTTTTTSGNSVEIDVSGRIGSLGMRSVELGDSVVVAHVFGDTDFEIAQKKIAAGDGISVADDGETVTISATGASSTEAFTGTRTVLADVDFSSPYLRKRFYTETWENGVLKSSTLGAWQNYHTSVEETV